MAAVMKNLESGYEPRAMQLRREEHVFNSWGYVMPEGEDFTLALDARKYFQNVLDKLRDGDSILIQSFDRRVWVRLLVISINTAMDPAHFDFVLQAVHPADLQLPEVLPQRAPQFAVRQAPGLSTYNVINLASGEPMRSNPTDRHSAMELASELQRAADRALGETVAAEFLARHHTDDASHVTEDESVTPGAARTRKWREKSRAISHEGADA